MTSVQCFQGGLKARGQVIEASEGYGLDAGPSTLRRSGRGERKYPFYTGI